MTCVAEGPRTTGDWSARGRGHLMPAARSAPAIALPVGILAWSAGRSRDRSLPPAPSPARERRRGIEGLDCQPRFGGGAWSGGIRGGAGNGGAVLILAGLGDQLAGPMRRQEVEQRRIQGRRRSAPPPVRVDIDPDAIGPRTLDPIGLIAAAEAHDLPVDLRDQLSPETVQSQAASMARDSAIVRRYSGQTNHLMASTAVTISFASIEGADVHGWTSSSRIARRRRGSDRRIGRVEVHTGA